MLKVGPSNVNCCVIFWRYFFYQRQTELSLLSVKVRSSKTVFEQFNFKMWVDIFEEVLCLIKSDS